MAIQLPPLSWTVIKFPPKYAVYIRGGVWCSKERYRWMWEIRQGQGKLRGVQY